MIDLDELKESEFFAVKSFKDSTYFGEVDPETNERTGVGII